MGVKPGDAESVCNVLAGSRTGAEGRTREGRQDGGGTRRKGGTSETDFRRFRRLVVFSSWAGRFGRGRGGGTSQNMVQDTGAGGGDVSDTIAPGTIGIHASVSATFELKR
jgi:hypothetical protein